MSFSPCRPANHQPATGIPVFSACLLILVSLIGGMIGCGRQRERYVPVSGIVTLNGTPLADAKLIFEPIGDSSGTTSGSPSYGRTDEVGHYMLKSFIARQKGAVAGRHRVRILSGSRRSSYSDKQISAAREYLIRQAKSEGVETQSLTDEQVLLYLSETQPALHQETIPARYNRQTELVFEVPERGSAEANFTIQSP